MDENYVTKVFGEINFEENFINDYNGLLLTNKEIQILNMYNIKYENCRNLNELLYEIDEILNEELFEDLEEVSKDIAERNYYQNTNK